MKINIFTMVPALVVGAILSSQTPAQDAKPQSLDDRISYAYGVVVARDLKNKGLPINVEQFIKAFSSVSTGKESLLTEAEIGKTFDENQQRMDEQKATGADKENLAAGKKFLAENAKKKGVKITERGLQYEVIKEGTGPKPTIENKVKVHYHGSLIDGTVFDSSVERKEPIDFPLTQVIPGWTEGLLLMPQGSKYRLYIPYHLAYGDAPIGPNNPTIKPYSALIFDVELLEIK